MSAELGHYALILALFMAVAQGVLPLIGAQRRDDALMALAGPAVIGQFVFISMAFACLMYAYVVSDFSVMNVAANSHSDKPLLYKFTAVWGNHEGSMVLWVWILSVYGLAVAAFGRNLPPVLKARVLAIQGLIGVGFLLFSLGTSNPFERLDPAPINGNGLNPLLQDPGLAFHPPLLYFGYVGLSMPFAFAIAALIEGRVDPAWARWVRPWTLVSWMALTAGITLGSWWAYYELGWGGFWFWDPVENASFMPWLMATALLHSALVAEKRDALKSWTVLIAILAFSLSLLGTFLVRSGLLTSVHSFASDPARGAYILGFLIFVIGGSLALYAWRAPSLKAGGTFKPISREGALLFNNLLLVVGCGTMFVGELYPIVLDAINGAKVSVGPPFFEKTFVPLMAPLLLVAAAGPMLAWKRADLPGVLQRLSLAFGALAAVIVLVYVLHGGPIGPAIGLGIAAWLFTGAAVEFADRVKLFRAPLHETMTRLAGLPRSALGTTLAHMGVAVVVVGSVAGTAWRTETVAVMKPGDRAELAGYSVTLTTIGESKGPNYTAQIAEMRLERDGELRDLMYPEKRFYPVQGTQTTEAAIRTTWFADFYIALGDSDAARGGIGVRLYHNPFVPWIWIGALMLVLGGGLSLSDRRLRVGAPAQRRAVATQPAPAANPGGGV
ncbi:MAG: heme lyase CcmF/NrfE family subunit [Alphaproteobacteria bacterium]|nr:heme lyase CcmF/NrfE family subunit [Alphaproteobacteria bacterium]